MKKILVVEDDRMLQRMYGKKLLLEKFEVRYASSSAQLWEKLENFTPDIILLDIMLSDYKNGFDIMEDLKRNPHTSSIPVLVLTNLDSEKNSALAVGAVDYMVKSNNSLEDVVDRIRTILDPDNPQTGK